MTKSASVSVPLVSFLTTVYGTEDYLPATIESVLAQTSPDWEMVIVDNGLSPSVVEIVSRYAPMVGFDCSVKRTEDTAVG